MFKKTMTFDNLEGEEVQQTFYFNYNKKEIAELLEFGRVLRFKPREGVTYLPLDQQMEKLQTPTDESGLSNRENNEMAYEIFQNLLLDAYGVKGDDNVSFDKTDELRHYWSTHVAFPELVFEFLENTQLAAEFIEKCLPPKLVAKAKAEMAAQEGRKVTDASLHEMVEEAARRQQDPETRVEPGVFDPTESPEVIKAAQAVADGGIPEIKIEDLTEEDILTMDEVSFKKLDPRKFSQPQLMAAFRRKTAEQG